MGVRAGAREVARECRANGSNHGLQNEGRVQGGRYGALGGRCRVLQRRARSVGR